MSIHFIFQVSLVKTIIIIIIINIIIIIIIIIINLFNVRMSIHFIFRVSLVKPLPTHETFIPPRLHVITLPFRHLNFATFHQEVPPRHSYRTNVFSLV